jgi:hypothetical protein
MKDVTFRFLRPDSLIGRLISWRLGEPWSHVSILIDDAAYSAEMPWVKMLPLTDKTVAMPPRQGRDIVLNMTEWEARTMKEWCESQVGRDYDYLSVLGWILGWDWLQNKSNSYCFEFCYKALAHIGWLSLEDRDLIKGNKLIEDIESYLKKLGINDYCEICVIDHDYCEKPHKTEK